MMDAATAGEIEKCGSDFQSNGTLQKIQQHSIQEQLLETVKQERGRVEPAETVDHLQNNEQLLEHCEDSQEELSAFIKNEPIEQDEPNTTQFTIYEIKDEVLPIESEDQHVNVSSSRFNCNLCIKTFTKKSYLKRHLERHKTHQYTCHLCDNSYKKDEYLRKHLRLHERTMNSEQFCHSCDLCGETFNDSRYLTRHMKKQHSIDRKPFSCDYCDQSFKNSYQLSRHKFTHTGELPFSCPECGKFFNTESGVTTHLPTHSEDKPYECPYCPLRFNTVQNMTRHKKVHEGGIKRQQCDICGQNVRILDLKRHKQTHSKEKPYKCDFCEQRFHFMQELRVHIRKHTGEKPYKCKYCERAFSMQGILRKHLRIHLGDNVFRCELYPLAFPLASELRLHFATHKNEDPETRKRNMEALKEEEAKLKLKLSDQSQQ